LKQPAARGRAYADIANAYRTLQRYDRAGEAYDSAVVFDRQAGLAASALRNRIWIAEVLADQGHLVAAESVHRETLAEARLIHGTQSAETAGELARLGDVLVGEGHVEDGERLLRESIVAYERLLARHDPKVSPTSIAGVQLALVRVLTSFDYVRLPQALAQAESIALMALATEIRVRSDSSPLVAGYYSWLARVQHRRGNPAGEQMLRAAHDRHRELWGEEHLRLDVERHALAEMALDRGALARADSLYRGIVERARSRAVRPEGLDSVLMGLGRVRLESGKFAAADTLLREALEWRQRIIPPGDPRIAEAQALLGAALAKQRRYHEAEPLLRAALPIVEKRWGDADRRTLTVRTALEQIQRGAPGAR